MTAAGVAVRPRRPAGPTVSVAARREQRRKWAYRAVFWGGLLVLWQVVAVQVGPRFLPTLDSIVTQGFGTFVENGYLGPFLDSWRQLGVGFGLTLLVTIPLGVWLGWSKVSSAILMPYANGFFVTPTAALLPLVILVVGTDLAFRVTVVVLFAFYYPLVNTAHGVRQTEGGLRDLAGVMCMSRLTTFRKVVVPAAMPYILVGVRLGLAAAVQGMVIAELWIVTGTGEILRNLAQFRRLAEFFAIVIAVVAIALLLSSAIRLIEVKVFGRRGMVKGDD